MYTETLEPSGSPNVVFICAVLCVGALYAAYRVLGALGVPYSAVFLFAGAAGLAYYLLRRYLTSYRYTIEEGCLYIERIVGNREQIVAGIVLCMTERFVPYGSEPLPKAVKCRATNRSMKNGGYVLDFRIVEGERLNRLFMHPSDELVRLIELHLEKIAEDRLLEKDDEDELNV